MSKDVQPSDGIREAKRWIPYPVPTTALQVLRTAPRVPGRVVGREKALPYPARCGQ